MKGVNTIWSGKGSVTVQWSSSKATLNIIWSNPDALEEKWAVSYVLLPDESGFVLTPVGDFVSVPE